MDLDELRVKFLKVYSNLPEKVKNEDIIAVIDDQFYSWRAASIEIRNESEVGKKILKNLHDLEII